MTTSIATSAPGKIVLSGEYAVLDGALGIAMALDRRAVVRSRTIDSDHSEFASPAFTEQVGKCDIRTSPIRWAGGAKEYSLVDAVLRRMRVASQSNVSMRLDTSAFVDAATGQKLGIGSSAALCVALVQALNGEADLEGIALLAHRDFQSGIGSGIDIACSVQGGLIRFSMQEADTMSLQWPEGLVYRVLWSGTAADTRQKIARLNSTAVRGEFPSRQRLGEASNEMAACWQSLDTTAVLAGYVEYLSALAAFDEDYALDIFAAGHRELAHAAQDMGLIYKPCGAGGGDVGILLGDDNEQLDEFFAQHGQMFKVVDCAMDVHGALVEQGVDTSEDEHSSGTKQHG